MDAANLRQQSRWAKVLDGLNAGTLAFGSRALLTRPVQLKPTYNVDRKEWRMRVHEDYPVQYALSWRCAGTLSVSSVCPISAWQPPSGLCVRSTVGSYVPNLTASVELLVGSPYCPGQIFPSLSPPGHLTVRNRGSRKLQDRQTWRLKNQETSHQAPSHHTYLNTVYHPP